MKKGLEELKNLSYELVASKAHIVQTTFDDIVNKRFEKLNPVKAKGLIKILEREFDLDLSEWTREFDAYHSIKEPELQTMDKLHAESIQKEKKPASKLALLLLGVAVFVGVGFILYLKQNSISSEANMTTATLQSEINETNASAAFNIAFDENKSELNKTAEQNTTELNKTAAVPEVNTTAVSSKAPAPEAMAPVAAQGTFFIEPTKKVWIGIRYLDTNKSRWFETVVDHRFDLNASREQLIDIGHRQVKIVSGASVIEAKRGGEVWYHYKQGKLTEISKEEYNKIAGITNKKETNETKPKQ